METKRLHGNLPVPEIKENLQRSKQLLHGFRLSRTYARDFFYKKVGHFIVEGGAEILRGFFRGNQEKRRGEREKKWRASLFCQAECPCSDHPTTDSNRHFAFPPSIPVAACLYIPTFGFNCPLFCVARGYPVQPCFGSCQYPRVPTNPHHPIVSFTVSVHPDFAAKTSCPPPLFVALLVIETLSFEAFDPPQSLKPLGHPRVAKPTPDACTRCLVAAASFHLRLLQVAVVRSSPSVAAVVLFQSAEALLPIPLVAVVQFSRKYCCVSSPVRHC